MALARAWRPDQPGTVALDDEFEHIQFKAGPLGYFRVVVPVELGQQGMLVQAGRPLEVPAGMTGTVRVKAVYLAIRINLAGEKEVLGLWIARTEGANLWLQVVTELKNRGVQAILIACVDGL